MEIECAIFRCDVCKFQFPVDYRDVRPHRGKINDFLYCPKCGKCDKREEQIKENIARTLMESQDEIE